MGWEYRSRGGPYYIRRTTHNGREVREYFGKGPAAARAAADDARKRAVQARERAEWEHLEALDALVTEVDQRIDLLMQAGLITAGFHQHHRGEWRKRRV